MQKIQSAALSRCRAADRFIEQNAGRLGTIPQSGMRRRLREVLDGVAQSSADQALTGRRARAGTSGMQRLRVALVRRHMLPIARVAALYPALEASSALRAPCRTRDERLVAWAMAMASAAEPHADAFVADGLDPEFVGQLRGAAKELADFATERKRTRGQLTASTRSISRHIREARRVLAALDAMMGRYLVDPSLTAQWSVVRRTGKVARRSSKAVVGGSAAAVPKEAGVIPIRPTRRRKA